MKIGDLEIGDVVTLKSGGPKLTVYNITQERITIRWFDGNKLKEDTTCHECLVRCDS